MHGNKDDERGDKRRNCNSKSEVESERRPAPGFGAAGEFPLF